MTDTQNQISQDPAALEKRLDELAAEATALNERGKADFERTTEEIAKADEEIDQTAAEVEEIFADLSKADQEAGDEMDKLILEQAESVADEE